MRITNRQIKNNIIRQLESDPQINAAKINVHVTRGAVQLSGSVATYPLQLAVHKNVWMVPGVRTLCDRMIVDREGNDARFSDAAIEKNIREALSERRQSDAADARVHVTARNRWVFLRGRVRSFWQKYWLETIVSEVPGVHGVTNAITVKPRLVVPDHEILHRLMALLPMRERGGTWPVAIAVKGGVVRISGNLASQKLYQQIRNAVLFAPGVIGFEACVRLAA